VHPRSVTPASVNAPASVSPDSSVIVRESTSVFAASESSPALSAASELSSVLAGWTIWAGGVETVGDGPNAA
jgi:hypothetical protein